MLEDVSACIIAKNEEKNLPRLLNSIRGKFKEIVLVDTGSTDRTVEVAESFGCRVFQTEWTGFSDARNFAVEKATGEWIWHFDADTELEEEEYQKFKSFFILNRKRLEKYEGLRVVYKNIESENSPDKFSYSSTIHIHKKADNIRWVGKIHERVININTGYISVPANASVKVLHYGYASSSFQTDKIRRNLSFILKEIKNTRKGNIEDYGVNLFYAVQTHLSAYHLTKNRKFLKKADFYIKKLDKISVHLQKEHLKTFLTHFCVYASNAYINMGEYERAVYFVDKGLEINPDYPDLLYSKAAINDIKGNKEEALKYFIQFLDKLDSFKGELISDYATKATYIASFVVPQIFSLISQERSSDYLSSIENMFKKSLNIHVGIALFSIYVLKRDLKNAEKLLNKLNRLYDDRDLIQITVEFLVRHNRKEDAEKFLANKLHHLNLNFD